ncbi:hypothetical protein [Haloplanus sp. C73]|uniref:hypothetical protein n=1 Tax=Haloplanus sp. C73 TaxID=3421641 RepID=UPI003EB774C1
MSESPPLDVDADLTLTVDGAAVSIRGYGDLVVVDAPSLAAVRALKRGRTTAVLDPLLRADVRLDVRVRGRSVARATPGRDAGPVARALGVDPLSVAFGGLFLTALTEWRANSAGRTE